MSLDRFFRLARICEARGAAQAQAANRRHEIVLYCTYNFETVVPPKFVTQMLAPSKATPAGSDPTVNVARVAPVVAFNFVTAAPLKSVTQILAPS
jgi:hypothetical protein